ncbi:hypothetical protein QUB47_34925 [Microcoleus sp. AT9_B5]
MVALFTKICDRPLVSFRQESFSLDSSCVKYARLMRSVERSHADCHLAIMVGPSLSGTATSALAKISG